MTYLDNIFNFIDALFGLILDIVSMLINALDGLLTFIIEFPTILGDTISSISGALSIFIAMFMNIPNNLWLGIWITVAGSLLYWLLFKFVGTTE